MLKKLLLSWLDGMLVLWCLSLVVPLHIPAAPVPQIMQQVIATHAPIAGGGSFTKVQIVKSLATCSASSSTCSITVSSTTGGGIGIIIGIVGGNYTLSSVSGAGTWTVDSGCHHYWGAGSTDMSCAYNLSETASVTSVQVTWNTSTPGANGFVYYEYSYSGSSVSFDTSGYVVGSPSANPQPGVALTLSGTKDIIVQGQGYGGPTSISSPYGNFALFNGAENGYSADSENTGSGTAPNWNYSGNNYALLNAIALKGN